MQEVLEKSKSRALKRYEFHSYDEQRGQDQGGWYRLLTKTSTQFTEEQYSVFRAVHRWRDVVARADDDSTVYVMPNNVLFNMARIMPTDKAMLFRVAQQVSVTMRQRADELLDVIAKAKADPNAAEMLEAYGRLRREEYAKYRPSNEFQNQQRNNLSSNQSSSAVADVKPRASSSSVIKNFKPVPNYTATVTIDIPKPIAPRSSTSTFWGPSLSDRSTEQEQEQEQEQEHQTQQHERYSKPSSETKRSPSHNPSHPPSTTHSIHLCRSHRSFQQRRKPAPAPARNAKTSNRPWCSRRARIHSSIRATEECQR